MSGSSLDGLDIACCNFTDTGNGYTFEITHADVVTYPPEWVQRIKCLTNANAQTVAEADAALGHYFGEEVSAFITKHNIEGIDVVASHGHTLFHFPAQKYTTQIGDGAAIAAHVNLPVACNFRTADIANGGQGTPIVPIGDLLLFNDYKLCLNMGGIANISCKTGTDSIVAFDICSANQVLNYFANQLGEEYDKGGAFAQAGEIDTELLKQLNQLAYYTKAYPKSLDNSFSTYEILPLIDNADTSIHSALRTYTEHIAIQIALHIKAIATHEKLQLSKGDKMMVTGGGAFNTFLMERIQHHSLVTIVVPDEKIVTYKEALVIALMGVLRLRNQVNVLKSVTGATKNTIGGAVYMP